ncbi:MAG TPA: Uma2 family endonuclease [Chloroflexota bacterium]|nr:Uma2 family endonuclease [Chloroflexota bacterium]
MAIQDKLMTAEELSLLPDDGQRHELVRGRLLTMAPPGEEHSWLQVNLIAPLAHHVRAHRLGRVYGELGCKLEADPDTVRATDAAFIRQERLTGPPQPGYWLGAPDLVVEVIWPNDRYTEVDDKVATWLAHGARLVLVVNPRWRTILVHRPGEAPRLLTEHDTLDGADVVPGWQIAVREIFA